MSNTIDRFKGTYAFLSNFYRSPITYNYHDFHTVEAAYQAAKSLDPRDWSYLSKIRRPDVAKRIGRGLKIRADWDEIKVSVMADLLALKFSDRALAARLIETGDAILIEGNTWGDTFWGVCDGVGENHLGRLLMALRDQLANSSDGVHSSSEN